VYNLKINFFEGFPLVYKKLGKSLGFNHQLVCMAQLIIYLYKIVEIWAVGCLKNIQMRTRIIACLYQR